MLKGPPCDGQRDRARFWRKDPDARWPWNVLGFQFVEEFEVGISRILLLHPHRGFLVGLYNHLEASADVFARSALALITAPSESAAKPTWRMGAASAPGPLHRAPPVTENSRSRHRHSRLLAIVGRG